MPDRIQRAYVAGPMTGYPDWNVPAFKEVAAKLRASGIACICPHEVIEQQDHLSWADYLRADLRVMLDCDSIILLPNWHKSRGATLEALIAYFCGLRLYGLTADLVPTPLEGLAIAPSIFTAVRARLLKV